MTTCTLYDDPISYNAPINYNGECVSPPVPPVGNPRGGATIYVVHQNEEELRLLRKRRREDEEILFL